MCITKLANFQAITKQKICDKHFVSIDFMNKFIPPPHSEAGS